MSDKKTRNLSLIGASDDFEPAPRSYVDELCDKAHSQLAFLDQNNPEFQERESLMDAIFPAFDELADTFFEPLRATRPDVAERGYYLLNALLKAAETIGRNDPILAAEVALASEAEAQVAKRKQANNAQKGKPAHQSTFAIAVKAEADALGKTPAKSIEFVNAVAPGVQKRIGATKTPGKQRIWTAVALLRAQKHRSDVS